MREFNEWYSPNRISFKREEVLWLLSNLETIRHGSWPNEHRETGYAGGKSKSHSHSAYYEKPIQVASELLQRIEKCWPDSSLLMLQVSYGDIEQVIANGEGQSIDKVQRRINTALNYICGKCPKWMDCSRCTQSNCKRRGRKPATYQEFKQHKRRGQPENS